MNIRTNRPIQYRFNFVHQVASGSLIPTTIDYGFSVEPSKLKLRITTAQLEGGIARTYKGSKLVSHSVERIGA